PTHGSRLYTLRPRNGAVPTGLHATAATPSGFTLAWTPPAGASAGTLYNVRVDGRTVATTADRQATVTGLRAVSAHTFTVTATAGHRTSAPSSSLTLTTPAAGGRVTYEAEAPDNRLTGGASIGSCAKCSGGKKVGN